MPEEHTSSLLSSFPDTSFSIQLPSGPSGNSMETQRYESSSGSSMSSDDELRLMKAEAKVAAAKVAELNARIEQKALESELRSRSSRGSRGSQRHKNTVTSPDRCGESLVGDIASPGSDPHTVYEPIGTPPTHMAAAVPGPSGPSFDFGTPPAQTAAAVVGSSSDFLHVPLLPFVDTTSTSQPPSVFPTVDTSPLPPVPVTCEYFELSDKTHKSKS